MALFAEGGNAQLKALTVTPLAKAMFVPEKK
jgi:levanase